MARDTDFVPHPRIAAAATFLAVRIFSTAAPNDRYVSGSTDVVKGYILNLRYRTTPAKLAVQYTVRGSLQPMRCSYLPSSFLAWNMAAP